ncbi:AAA family ATPase [Heyndrickxia acidiproducens]|uniref:AAA family ATPase n=1 Tax=Heyndrickxia acidiproducens TaxID=1121084 RepID=UPI000368C2ED|nr:AAA family ATPase [Heyndrickxia acidiproducens]
MKINFNTLALQNFKSHQNLTVNFGEETQVTGDNAKGKSSIFEAITWLLYGTDTLGSKLDPTAITYEAEKTLVTLLLEIDGKQLLLGRELKKGKIKYLINDVPSKAGEFNEILDKLFDKDLFLSLFNPAYFFTLHWEKQRAMLLQYVTPPANKEVLAKLPEQQGKTLGDLLKKHSLGDIEKIHRSNKSDKDKKYIAAQSRTKTLKEQLETSAPEVPLESLNAEHAQLVKQRNEIEKVTDSASTVNGRINILQNKIKSLMDERDRIKDDFKALKDAPIQDTCPTCKQPLQNEAVKAVKANKQEQIDRAKDQFNSVVAQRKKLEAELKDLEYVDVSEQLEKARELQGKINQLEIEINKHRIYKQLQEQVEQARAAEKEVLQSLNESIFIVDSVKAFRAKEAELQAEKVQALFGKLSIKLFEEQKNGDLKITFEIEMDGKPYRKLSLSEGIRAGLELRNVISEQSGVVCPVFIDNSESITFFDKPNGQLIVSRVVAGKELKVDVK